MVNAATEGETLKEIAARHGRAYNTVRAHWSRHPDWPAPIDKRGRENLYDPAAVDAVIARHFVRTATELEARRLYTAREIEDLTGVSAATIRADRSKGRWPAPDDTSNRAHRWLGAAVSKALEGRRGYRKDGN
ncbi:helix-turn-helix transcriptional regulator [Streptomyces sp. NPDC052207]|uniref:helix-turn-helix transcriptional regulator n=1 Tax=Streptomyces sp. NPDC052207 TaxID=3155418 RepID=UPI00343F9F84